MSTSRQAVILCGGLGTRLGELTATTPKPLLPVNDQPFLDTLLFELGRNGFCDIVLLAGFEAEKVLAYCQTTPLARRFNLSLRVSIEPERAGTGGALYYAKDLLADTFLLLNGDSWFDINLSKHYADGLAGSATAHLALRALEDASRFGVVEQDAEGQITAFFERPQTPAQRLVNGGVYFMRKEVLEYIPQTCSLEQETLPKLAAFRQVSGQTFDGFFIDIGMPDKYAEAHSAIPAQLQRTAVFLDRDGIINVDHGHVGTRARFEWYPEIIPTIAALNDQGHYVFVVTNQAGVAKGYYPEANVLALHTHIQTELHKQGAHIDAFRYCPHHPQGVVPHLQKPCSWRKPGPGMILDLIAHWPIDRAHSLLIGDRDTDVAAAQAAGLAGHRIAAGTLHQIIQHLIPHAASDRDK
ncbi:MAG: HAD-IIIA family hydrolase [Pseudomonadota bacterium]